MSLIWIDEEERPARSLRPRACFLCDVPIWPGQAHHRLRLADGRERRAHRRGCPGVNPVSGASRTFEAILIALAWIFALAMVGALWFAAGYGW